MTDELSLDRIIDLVLNYLANHRESAIQNLFGEACESYRDEWRDRDVLKFWSHLDLGNRRQLIKLAVTYYGYSEVALAKRSSLDALI